MSQGSIICYFYIFIYIYMFIYFLKYLTINFFQSTNKERICREEKGSVSSVAVDTEEAPALLLPVWPENMPAQHQEPKENAS